MAIEKHTPGPWFLTESEANGDDLISVDSSSRHITLHTIEAPEDVANARLIAAAPDLVAALKALASSPEAGEYESEYDGRVYTLCSGCNFQDDVRPYHDADCTFAVAQAAIVKAEGR